MKYTFLVNQECFLITYWYMYFILTKLKYKMMLFCRNKQAVAPCLVLDASTELLCQNNGGWCCMLGMASGGST